MSDFKSKYGPWALVTGASSGIGREFSQQLAAKGFNLVLIARRKALLDGLGQELESKYGILAKSVAVDLSESGTIDIIDKATKEIEIGLLVPNAGTETHGAFLKHDLDWEAKLVQLNITTPMALVHHFGQKMAERGRGGIILISSTMGYQAVPYMANYAATKAYILTLGESLHYELKRNGVDVTVLSPGMTNTAMPANMAVDFSKMPMKAMEVGPVVETALNALGRKPSVIPGVMNNMMAFMGRHVMSRQGVASIFGGMMAKAVAKDKI